MSLVLLRLHLEAVVREVDELVVVVERVLVRRRATVARLVVPQVFFVVDHRQHSDVELSAVVQQRPFDVLLQHVVFAFGLRVQGVHHVAVACHDFYACPSVFVFWLQNPEVLFQLPRRQGFEGDVFAFELFGEFS